MCDTLAKHEMEEILTAALSERGISPRRTRIGWDVICRTGDPTSAHDMARVGTHDATSIVLMLTEKDQEGVDASEGKIQNAGTITGMLALRHVLLTGTTELRDDLRVTVQLSAPSVYATTAAFTNARGEEVVKALDLSVVMNSLMFSCAITPGLSRVLLELLNFESAALRCRDACELRGPGGNMGGLVGLTMAQAAYAWEDAVLVGVAADVGAGGGICGNPDRPIAALDRLIFVSKSSAPSSAINKRSSSLANIVEGSHESAPRRADILVCGWRDKWNKSTTHLRDRIDDLAQQLTPGPSNIVFMNLVEPETFARHMATCGLAPAPGAAASWNCSRAGVTVTHVHGDAVSPDDLAPVITERAFSTVIVLGTSASVRLSSHMCDMRVLSIMLLLRHLLGEKRDQRPVHIVGENQEDATSMLALAPKLRGHAAKREREPEHDPDFVNTQAIVARALCQSIAYPRMNAALSELFNDQPGSAAIEIRASSRYFAPNQSISFVDVRKRVAHVSGQTAVCIGYVNDEGQHVIVPALSSVIDFKNGARLIMLKRDPVDLASSGGRRGTVFEVRDPANSASTSSQQPMSLENMTPGEP